MGRYVGSSINKGSGGGGGSGTIVQTDTFTRSTGITTDANNNVTSITIGDEGNKYEGMKYNAVGLITAYNETINDTTKGFSLVYDSQNLVTSITEVPEWTFFNVSPTSASANEGATVTTNVSTNGADGTYYWDTDSDDDITTNSGSFSVSGGTGSFQFVLENDLLTEGSETLAIRVYSGSVGGSLLGTGSVTINDTSTAPLTSGQIFHAAAYNATATHNWTVPSGVTSISVVCVGGGGGGESNHDGASAGGGGLAYKNNITVVAGQVVTVKVGGGGWPTSNGTTDAPDGGNSYITYGGVDYAVANGGRGGDGNQNGNAWYDNSGSFPNTNSDGGGAGGAGFHGSGYRSGGGGAGGYNGGGNTSSGRGCNSQNYAAPQTGQNGGGGGGNAINGSSPYYSGGGGGTGVYGEGTSGTKSDANGNNNPDDYADYAGKGGSTSNNTGLRGYCVEDNSSNWAAGSDLGNGYSRSSQASAHGSNHWTPDGGFPGGGGGGSNSGSSSGCGGHGMVRIVYGLVSSAQRTFPSTNVGESTTYGGTAEGVNGTQLMY